MTVAWSGLASSTLNLCLHFLPVSVLLGRNRCRDKMTAMGVGDFFFFYLWVCDTFQLLNVPIVGQILSKLLSGNGEMDGGRNWDLLSL